MPVKSKIDLNCDLGEGLGNEHLLMPFLSSCSIACGAHAGSVETMDKVIALAQEHNVKIGAHPSFPDRENFGRLIMELSDADLAKSLREQLRLFRERADRQGAKVNHVKAHGALYNLIAVDREKAEMLVSLVQEELRNAKIYVPFTSAVEKVAREQGITIVYEAFADRNYNDDLTLVPRLLPRAVIAKENVLEHVRRMVVESKVKTIEGQEVAIKADTLCIHGDNPNALDILVDLNKEFRVE